MPGNIKPMSQLLKENSALRKQVKELTKPLDEKEQLRAQLAVGLEPLVEAMLAVRKRREQNENDKVRQIEILHLRTPLVQLPDNDPDKAKLKPLDEELHAIQKRQNFFAKEITELSDAEKQVRRNFAGC